MERREFLKLSLASASFLALGGLFKFDGALAEIVTKVNNDNAE